VLSIQGLCAVVAELISTIRSWFTGGKKPAGGHAVSDDSEHAELMNQLLDEK